MNAYTPTTEDIADAWRSRYDSEHHWAVGEERRGYEAEFDRWLNKVKAEAWDEGHEAAAMRIPEGVWHDTASAHPTNPYRQEKPQ